MKTVIKGQRYIFDICADMGEFYIRALHRASSRFSCINNLNAILSELSIDTGDIERNEEFGESRWDVSERESCLFFKKAASFLRDKNYRSYIESKLDEDRDCGEWENRQRVKRKGH